MKTPLFPVLAPSTRTPAENTAALNPHCHVVEVKDGYALVHASPTGVVKISELGLEVYHSKRGGEYYAVRVGREEPPKRVDPPRVASASGSGSALVIRGGEYRVLETRPKRRQDQRRFEVRKDDGECYVVSFQLLDGSQAQCSCKDWIYRRHECKHIRSIREATQAAQAA